MRIAAVASCLALCCRWMWAESGPVVKVDAGSISGTVDATTHISVFKGVPFAAPPIGDLRWREPQPVRAWSGVRDATKFGASCMQRVHGDALPWTREYLVQNEVSEDCLYLNVWTPETNPGAKLPVLVYIPGGAFSEGSGEVPIYDGASLASKRLVIVTINYRLGALGFLAHPDLTAESPHHASGNYGLMDQVAALRWVQKNIAGFGGDPPRVTAWGQSAGAFSVGALLASTAADGLFERAMADSGLSVAGFPTNDLHKAEQDGVSWAVKHHATNLKELRSLPANDLVGGGNFHPIIDGWLLTETPNAANASGGGNDVPVVTGYQANDGLLFSRPVTSVEEYNKRADTLYGDMAEEFKRLYPGGSTEQLKNSLQDSARDRERVSMFLWAKQRVQGRKSAVYTYFFDRGIPWPQHPEFGAFHSGELPYFFANLKLLDRPWKPIDRQLSETASSYLKNFAATGNPNGAGLPRWPAVKAAVPETFEIGENVQPIPLADKAKCEFWIRYFGSQQAAKAPIF